MSQSLYEYILEHVNEDGLLDDDFSLPDTGEELKAVDGAWDGICVYHMGAGPLKDDQLKQMALAVQLMSDGKREEADNELAVLTKDVRALILIDDIQQHIIDNKDAIDANNLFHHCWHMILDSDNRELIKVGMSILEIMDVPEEMKDIIRTLGLSNEFTVFAMYLMRCWENGSEEVFELAKKVHGWGRVHAVELIEPENDEIKHWFLTDAVNNCIMPAYSGLTCFEKADVVGRLADGNLSSEEVKGILSIIDAMLDEGPVSGISTLEDPESLLVKVLECAEAAMPLDILGYETVNNISNWQEENGEDDNPDIEALVDSILGDERCRKCVADEVKKGRHVSLAEELGLDYKADLFAAMKENLEETYSNCCYLTKDKEYADKVFDLFRENLPLEELKTGAADSLGLGEDYKYSTMMSFILQELRYTPGKGEDFVETAIQMAAVRNRNGAVKVMQCWVEDTKMPLEQLSPRLYKVLCDIKGKEVKRHLIKQIEELINGELEFFEEEYDDEDDDN